MASRLTGALLPLLLLLSLAGCGRAAPSGDVLRIGLAQAPATLDPRFATDAASARVTALLYRPLVELDEAGNAVPGLAEWSRVAPSRYVFRLLPGIPPFSDGSPVTAADVKATYDALRAPGLGSPHRSALAMIDRVEVREDASVEFVLNRADPLFPAFLHYGVLPARRLDSGHDFGDAPVGNGAFTLLERRPDGGVSLRRRRDGMRLDLVEVKDPTVRALKLIGGELDLIQNDLPAELANYLAGRAGLRVDSRPGITFAYLGLNLADPALSDPRVREAIALAVDREAIVRHLFRGFARVGESILPATHWAGAPLPARRPDTQRARALLAQAGFTADRPLHLVYKTSADPFRVRLATAIQDQLAAVGVEVDVRSFDWGTFYGDVKAGRFQLYSLAWVGVHTPDILRLAFHSASVPPAGANRGRYRSAELDRLIEQAENAEDLAQMAECYREAQALVHADLPMIPLWHEDNVAVMRDAIRGYRVASDGNYRGLNDVEWVDARPQRRGR
jgi:peptide/nickel transport system substrate-binding protein